MQTYVRYKRTCKSTNRPAFVNLVLKSLIYIQRKTYYYFIFEAKFTKIFSIIFHMVNTEKPVLNQINTGKGTIGIGCTIYHHVLNVKVFRRLSTMRHTWFVVGTSIRNAEFLL
jgi:hypothetical protein